MGAGGPGREGRREDLSFFGLAREYFCLGGRMWQKTRFSLAV